MFLIAYGLGISMTYFFIFSATYLQQSNVIFGGLIFAVIFTFIFSWLYFRGVPGLTWRQRAEVIAVWIGLMILTDMLLLVFVQGGSVSQLTFLTVGAYALQLFTLFTTAYLTSGGSHPRLASPNLVIDQSKDAS